MTNSSRPSPNSEEPELKTAGSFNGYRIIYDPKLTQGWIEFRAANGDIIGRIDGVEAIHLSGSRVSGLLPDGRSKHAQEMSLLRSQLANCHKEIQNLRNALVSTLSPRQRFDL